MNLDLFSVIEFGNAQALTDFFLAHRIIHEQEAVALAAKFKMDFSTIGMESAAMEEEWIRQQLTRRHFEAPALRDWLQLHAAIHNDTYEAIGGPGFQAPDLSIVDFSKPHEFYQWMFSHTTMHDFEQSFLGLS